MSEDAFRWVVSVAVVLACIAFIVQSAVVAAAYLAAKKAQKTGKEIQGKLAPIIDRVHAIADTTSRIADTASRILDENRPHIAHIITEASLIAKTARQETDRIGELIDDTSKRARIRIDQIDHTVDETIAQVEQVRETVKSTVMRPAKEVNGILNGVRAALNSYAEGRRPPSVDTATQDEEMFI